MTPVLIPVYSGRADRSPDVVAYAIVDEGDAGWARSHHWTLRQGYATRRLPRPATASVLMHREILGLDSTDALVADHINRQKLDNRRANLRAVDRSANNQNRDSYSNGGSRFRGVSWHADKNRWRATAQAEGVWTFIGYFDTEEEAAEAARQWRSENMPYSYEEATA